MKRIMRKNQVIITVLAVMIAIAGYLTYAGRVEVADNKDISMENTSDAKEAIAEYDTIDTAKEDATDAALTDIESLDQDIDDPGKMVLANGLTVSDYMAQTKLAREQTRGKNKEDLLAIIDSDAQTELDKQYYYTLFFVFCQSRRRFFVCFCIHIFTRLPCRVPEFCTKSPP